MDKSFTREKKFVISFIPYRATRQEFTTDEEQRKTS